MRFGALFLAAFGLSSFASAVSNGMKPFQRAERAMQKRQAIVEKRLPHQPFQNERLQKRASHFATKKTQKFAVNGTGIPDVPFDIGESYAGLLPVSNKANETRELFFWFFPTTNAHPKEDITIWFTGGPGCSSLSGFLTENGAFTWEAGTLAPVQNPYTWVNLTNMLWVEQPIGVGYTQGNPDIYDEKGLAKEFLGFYDQFAETFDVKTWDIYITGESYGGFYVPYVANAFIKQNSTNYPLKGIAFNDPIMGDGTIQQGVTIEPYVEYWQNLLYLNTTARANLKNLADKCGYTKYIQKYLTYPPPKGPFPSPNYSDECEEMFDVAYSAILEVNPCFNIYHITETCPHPYSVLGATNPGDYVPPGLEVYFNRTDVQKALNAPVGTNWQLCTDKDVFLKSPGESYPSDASPGPALDGTLQNVIEHTNNVIIGSGNLDFLLNTNGTLLALQNVTWNGKQGLQSPPNKPFFVPYHAEYNGGALSEAGIVGSFGHERGLTFYQVQLAGHELPGYTPGAGYRSIELMLGRISSLDQRGSFTTQNASFHL